MDKIINMTPHNININGVSFESKGTFRLEFETELIGSLANIPISKTVFKDCYNLPKFKDDTFYIVSSLLCRAYPNRKDFLIVNETIRENGKIVGCNSLAFNPF